MLAVKGLGNELPYVTSDTLRFCIYPDYGHLDNALPYVSNSTMMLCIYIYTHISLPLLTIATSTKLCAFMVGFTIERQKGLSWIALQYVTKGETASPSS